MRSDRIKQFVELTTQPKDYRKELWIAIATNVARAEDCKNIERPGQWADKTLAAFDRTFPAQGTAA